ncbi:YkvA family protein [Constantimarinum furrinae]|uniref:DUF1232 domain-containing protein n=1 Tax=Constantimarinum furrinae TaxID=2562285 RepID=A0A7G8PUT0_9FLAO|nr:YkvA family protein [Constantimarinum furrinae]QNJ98096.1 hypothetical protein ALE3EI_1538 [Constantimarinum furrinae]
MSLKGIFKRMRVNTDKKTVEVDRDYVEDQVTEIEEGDVEILLKNEEEITKKLSRSNSFGKYLDIGKLMIAMVKDIKRGEYKRVPWFTIATIVMALLYVLNPLDLVPDFIPGLGYLDDVAVLSIGIGWIESDLHSYIDWKLDQGSKQA